jgi:hypothetical protein
MIFYSHRASFSFSPPSPFLCITLYHLLY